MSPKFFTVLHRCTRTTSASSRLERAAPRANSPRETGRRPCAGGGELGWCEEGMENISGVDYGRKCSSKLIASRCAKCLVVPRTVRPQRLTNLLGRNLLDMICFVICKELKVRESTHAGREKVRRRNTSLSNSTALPVSFFLSRATAAHSCNRGIYRPVFNRKV